MIQTQWYHPWGVYFPANLKVENFGFNKKSFKSFNLFRKKKIEVLEKESFDFIQMSNDSLSVELKFLNSSGLEELSIGVDMGDEGATGSNIGYKSFGGYIIISLHGKHELNIKEGMKVSAIDTFLCKSYE